MKSNKLNLYIDTLVIDGLTQTNQTQFMKSLSKGLKRQFTEQGLPERIMQDCSITQLSADKILLNSEPSAKNVGYLTSSVIYKMLED